MSSDAFVWTEDGLDLHVGDVVDQIFKIVEREMDKSVDLYIDDIVAQMFGKMETEEEKSVELDSTSDLLMHHFMTDNGVVHEPEIEQYWSEEQDRELEEYLAEYLASMSDTEEEDIESDDSFNLLPKLRHGDEPVSFFMFDS